MCGQSSPTNRRYAHRQYRARSLIVEKQKHSQMKSNDDFSTRRNAAWKGQKHPEGGLTNTPNRAQKRSGRPFFKTKMTYEMTLERVVSCFPEASPEDGKVSGVTTRCCT
jgi:hypothetical protein